MVTFRRQLDPLMAELRRDILPRHPEWISAGAASALCDAYDNPAEAGRCEWWLWTFVVCDALVEAAPAISASSRPSPFEVIQSAQRDR